MNRLAPLALAVVLLAGCSRATTPPIRVSAAKGFDPASVRTIAVTAAQAIGSREEVEPKATSELFEILVNAASAETAWSVVDPDRVAVHAEKLGGEPSPASAGKIARSSGADAALTATISRWRDRVGGGYGASEPASVAILVLLVPAGGEQPAWTAEYAITQQPLAYNLWNLWGVLRGGPRWLTASELAKIGVEESVHRLAGGRR